MSKRRRRRARGREKAIRNAPVSFKLNFIGNLYAANPAVNVILDCEGIANVLKALYSKYYEETCK